METTVAENRVAGKARRGVTLSGILLFYLSFCLIFLYRYADAVEPTSFDVGVNIITKDLGSAISILYLLFFYKKTLTLLRKNIPLLLISIFALISCFWAINPVYSIKQWLYIGQCTSIIMAFVVISKDAGSALRLMAYPLSILLVASLIAGAFFPSIGRHDYTGVFTGDGDLAGNWKGVFNHKNAAGLAIIILAIISIGYGVSKPKISAFISYLCVFFLACAFLYFAKDKTVYFAFGVCLIVFAVDYFSRFIFRVSFYSSKIFCLTLTMIFMIILFFFNYFGIVYLYPKYGINFTDRVSIWQLNLDYWRDHPFLGHGFFSVYMVNDGIRKFSDTMGAQLVYQAHSGILSILGEMGFVGCFFLFILLSTTLYKVFRILGSVRSAQSAILAMSFVIIITTSLTEAIYLRHVATWYISCTIILLINAFPLSSENKNNAKAVDRKTVNRSVA